MRSKCQTSSPAGISCKRPGRPTSPTACCAPWTATPSTIAAPNSAPWAAKSSASCARVLQTEGDCRDLPRLRHRRVGGGDRQHAVARRPRADEPHRLVLASLGTACDTAPARPGVPRHRLAARRRPGGDRRRAGGRPRASHQGGLRRAVRDVDKLHDRRRRGARRDGPRAASGAADGGRDLLAGLRRLAA